MLSKLAKLLLVLTSLAPILFSFSFVSWLRGRPWLEVVTYLLVAACLTVIAVAIIRQSRRHLTKSTIQIESLKTVDKEIIGFLLAYLLPLVSHPLAPVIDWRVGAFVLAIFFVVVWGTHSYNFNPLLGILGFHFFEVTTSAKVTYVLITRQDLYNTRNVTDVVQISEYMLLDATMEKKQ